MLVHAKPVNLFLPILLSCGLHNMPLSLWCSARLIALEKRDNAKHQLKTQIFRLGENFITEQARYS